MGDTTAPTTMTTARRSAFSSIDRLLTDVRAPSVDSRRVSPVRLFCLKVGYQITRLSIRDDSFNSIMLWYTKTQIWRTIVSSSILMSSFMTSVVYNDEEIKNKKYQSKKWWAIIEGSCTVLSKFSRIILRFFWCFTWISAILILTKVTLQLHY